MPIRVTFVCCGATGATRRGAFARDEPLEPAAEALLPRLAAAIRRADRVLSGPARRAVQTAAALRPAAVVRDDLGDWDAGRWAGSTLAEVAAAEPEGFAAWLSDPGACPHGGESLNALLARVRALLDGLAAGKGHVVAVTHAAVMRAAVTAVLSAPAAAFWSVDVEPFGCVALSGEAGRWRLRFASPLRAAAKG